MDIWDANKFLLFIAFVIPGFISLKTYELLFPGIPKTSDKLLIDIVTYSSINYTLLLWPIYSIETLQIHQSHPTLYILFYVVVLLIAPIAWAYMLGKLRTTEFLQHLMPHPSLKPWDFVFSQRKPYWVIVTLKGGSKIAGRYDSNSFASSAPAVEQLYLEEHWVLNVNEGFERPRTETAGILILSHDILTVELFKLTEGITNAREETSSHN